MPKDLTCEVRIDTKQWAAEMSALQRQQLPYATMLALNSTIIGARDAVRSTMDRVFDRPTPYAKRGINFNKATKGNLVASVNISGVSGGVGEGHGLPAAVFLGPQISGGQRSLKAFERQLRERGLLPAGHVAVPARRTKRDRYGNMTQGFLNRLMADLQINYRGAGADRLRTERSLKRNKRYQSARFFVPDRTSNLKPGIYQRVPQTGSTLPVMLFVRAKAYTPRLPFEAVVRRHAEQHFDENFIAAFGKAMATARR